MPYRSEDISHCIVHAVSKLRPGRRAQPITPKELWDLTVNIPALIAGISNGNPNVHSSYVIPDGKQTYKEYVAMASAMVAACDADQLLCLEDIFEEITMRMRRFKKQFDDGKISDNGRYVFDLEEDDLWGLTVRAFYEAFPEKTR